jgi:hypothetical protein
MKKAAILALSLMLGVFFTFSFIGVVNADFDDGRSDSASSDEFPIHDTGVNSETPLPAFSDRENAPSPAPTLGLAIKETTVMLSWNTVSDATGYRLFYAPYPNASPIESIDMGSKTSISANLWEGAAFYLAVQAYNSSGNSAYSNIIHFLISSSDSVYDYAQDYVKAYNDGDADFQMTRYSKDYLSSGEDYDCQYSLRKYWFAKSTYENTTYYINNVTEYTQNNKTLATINRTMNYSWYNQSGEGPYTSTSTGDTHLILEDGKWKAYGNQEGYQAPSAELITCESAAGFVPVGIKTVFTESDKKVTILTNLKNMGNGFTISKKWYAPDGSLDTESSYVFDHGERPLCDRFSTEYWFSLKIEGYTDQWNAQQGQWRVDVYINGTLAAQTYFEYRQN